MYELQTKESRAGLDWGGDWAFESRRDAFTGARLLMDFFAPDEGCGVRILLSDGIVAKWEPAAVAGLWKGGAS